MDTCTPSYELVRFKVRILIIAPVSEAGSLARWLITVEIRGRTDIYDHFASVVQEQETPPSKCGQCNCNHYRKHQFIILCVPLYKSVIRGVLI